MKFKFLKKKKHNENNPYYFNSLSALVVLFFKATDYILNMENCRLKRFWTKYLVSDDPEDKPEPIKFSHIKPVTLIGKIRIFNNFGNPIVDIFETGKEKYADYSFKSQEEVEEVLLVRQNYLKVYEQLKATEKLL